MVLDIKYRGNINIGVGCWIYKWNITVVIACYSFFSPPKTDPTKSEPEREKVRTLKIFFWVIFLYFIFFSYNKVLASERKFDIQFDIWYSTITFRFEYLYSDEEPRDGKPLGADVNSVLIATPLSVHLRITILITIKHHHPHNNQLAHWSPTNQHHIQHPHRFVLVRGKLFVFNLLLLGKVCRAGEYYQFVVRIRSMDKIKQYLQRFVIIFLENVLFVFLWNICYQLTRRL